MHILQNIRTVAKYESKILLRSWFFKVFSIIALAILFFYNLILVIQSENWPILAIPANMPYVNMVLLNIAQSVIAIFLSSEFLKRDKKLDTSEVFYVRPLSNAEYVIGKIWGDLRVFFVLDLIVLAMVLIFNFISPVGIDAGAYVMYFLLICIPSLIYMIGLSIFLMLVINNQALTFIVLLAYIGFSLFYLDDKFFFAFDFAANSLPMFKSTIIGLSNTDLLVSQRFIYLSFGLMFICASIVKFKRLPNSRRSLLPWKILSVLTLVLTLGFGFGYVNNSLSLEKKRVQYVNVNNKYVHSPKIVAESYRIDLEQKTDKIIATADINGYAVETSDKFVFRLNPGFKITSVKSNGQGIPFERDMHILIVDFGRMLNEQENVSLSISYEGTIDESICYLDIPDEEIFEKKTVGDLFNVDKRYGFQKSDYILFTPELSWYPSPGTSFSDVSLDWQQTYFSKFVLNIKTLSGLTAISHGNGRKTDDGMFVFEPEFPLQAASLIVGNYDKISASYQGVEYSAWYIKGNDDYFEGVFDSIADTIPSLIYDFLDNVQRTYGLTYPFDRFSVVETPGQFTTYQRMWTQAQETMQPEIVLFPEKGYNNWGFNFKSRVKREQQNAQRRGQEITEQEALIRAFRGFPRVFTYPENNSGTMLAGGQVDFVTSGNPYFIYPQLYNFRYNVYSSQWTVANRLIESFLQTSQTSRSSGWIREMTGLSNEEKVNILSREKSFTDLLSDVTHRTLISTVISMNASRLFAPAELNYGVDEFREFLFSLLKENDFNNIRFESLLDTLTVVTGAEFDEVIAGWNAPLKLPNYFIGTPTLIFIQDRNDEFYQMDALISNMSDVKGIIRMEVPAMRTQYSMAAPGSGSYKWLVELGPNETKRLVSHWDDAPRGLNINTMMSRNLPQTVNQTLTSVTTQGRIAIHDPGEFVVPSSFLRVPGEVIVDNEDPYLFSLSEPAPSGYLQKWLIKDEDAEFRYKGLSAWRAPIQWTLTSNMRYYGEAIRSAYVIKGGSGGSYARWKVPVPEEGQYELYFFVNKPDELRRRGGPGGARGGNQQQQGNQRNRSGNEWQFKVGYDGDEVDAYINIQRADEGWTLMGVYNFPADTVTVTLSDKTQLSRVTADAVKIVRR